MNPFRIPIAAATGLLLAAPLVLAARITEVDVVVDMTPAGRLVPPPTPAKPAYYVPILGGYKEMGQIVAGEPPPPTPAEVAHLVAKSLADQGYLVVHKGGPQPSLILAVVWGYLNPEIEKGLGGAGSRVFFNQDQMLALVGGNTLGNLDLNFEREGVMQAAEEDRYFVTILAFDYAAYAKTHKKVKLWQAKMSVPSNGVTLADVLPVLARAGGPMYGRETTRPKMLILPVTPEGHVEVGNPTVKDYQDAPVRKPKPVAAPDAPAPNAQVPATGDAAAPGGAGP